MPITRISGTHALFLLFSTLLAGGATAEVFGPCAIPTTAPDTVVRALDGILLKTVEPGPELTAAMGAAPGAVLSVRGPDWAYARSAGVADPKTGAPIDCEMPFQIGSNTKMMTAVVLLQLVEEGRLSLDDPLSRHLPQIADALPHGDAMTLRQLATHTSGVFSYTDSAPDGTPGIMEGDISDPAALRRGYRPESLVDFAIAHGTPDFAPGMGGNWSYSNTGYVLLGLVIEKIEGRPIGDSYNARIFDPLGMPRTFLWNGVPEPEFGLPRSFFTVPFEVETTDWNMSQGWAAGGVISTARDMHRFMEALFAGALFQSPDTLAVMQDTVPTDMVTLPRYGIGLGEKTRGLWGHGGQTLGFESDVALIAGQGISVVGWGTSSHNAMVIGALSVSQELQRLAIIPDSAQDATAMLSDQVIGPVWQLVSVTRVGGPTEEIETPERYQIEFFADGRFAAQTDCNRLLGGWSLAGRGLSIVPGPSTLAACPPGSLADVFVAALGATTGAEIAGGRLAIRTDAGNGASVLTFEASP